MHILSLTDMLDRYVRAKVAFGLHDSASDVIHQAPHLKTGADASHEATDPGTWQAENGDPCLIP